jgi:antitoxin (DNA-binding transcriptional repressor) of toxin-antitoxin stability system
VYFYDVHDVRLNGTLADVKVTSTEFRKNLFRIVERALQGEFVEVAHKGRLVRLVPGDKPSKMSRLIQRDTIHGTPEDLDRGQRDLDAEMRTSWEGKWAPKP